MVLQKKSIKKKNPCVHLFIGCLLVSLVVVVRSERDRKRVLTSFHEHVHTGTIDCSRVIIIQSHTDKQTRED